MLLLQSLPLINNKKVLAITLARGGSKGVPHKNIRPLAGKPLLQYTTQAVLNSSYIDHYVVSTDDPDIQSLSISLGAESPFLRSQLTSSDTASSTDALIETVSRYEELTSSRFDFIIECMATSPFKSSTDIDSCIELLHQLDADSVIGVTQLFDHHPARAKQIIDGKITDFCVPELSFRRQDLSPPAYIRNGSIYALSRDALLLKKLRFGGNNSIPYIMPAERSVNVDTELDFLLCDAIISKKGV